jgi:hypothetical protein
LPIAAVLGIAAIGVVGLRQGTRSPQASAETKVAASPAPKPVSAAPRRDPDPVAVPKPPDPPPAPAPETSASAVADKPPEPKLADAFAAALSATPTSVQVTVRITPEGAAIFDQGKRLGTDMVTVNVEPGSKMMLSALLNGYQPKRFSIDGTQSSVTIALKPHDPSFAQSAPAPVGTTAAPGTSPTPTKPVRSAPAEAFDPTRDVGSL